MNEFIEKNRRLLRFLCDTLRSLGQIVLLLGSLGVCAIVILMILSKLGYWNAPKSFEMLKMMPLSAVNIFFLGIGMLGLAQFIRYLIESDYKPGWILRHGEIFLYLYALLIILSVVWVYVFTPFGHSQKMYSSVTIVIVVFSTSVRVLILVGLGRILHYLMPVIEESKSLV